MVLLHSELITCYITKSLTNQPSNQLGEKKALVSYLCYGSAYIVLVGKPEGNRPHGRPRRRWKDIIKMDLQEVGCGGMDWIELTGDRDR